MGSLEGSFSYKIINQNSKSKTNYLENKSNYKKNQNNKNYITTIKKKTIKKYYEKKNTTVKKQTSKLLCKYINSLYLILKMIFIEKI